MQRVPASGARRAREPRPHPLPPAQAAGVTGARKRARKPARFVAVDGESYNPIKGEPARYFLLVASTGRSAYAARGLSTLRCFDFLLGLRRSEAGSVLVCFGLNYDVNHWLRDVNVRNLRELWETGETTVMIRGRKFLLEWIPGKFFGVKDVWAGDYARVSEVWGFFQSSFVAALEKWDVPDPGGLIARMKAERSEFDLTKRSEIERYALAECGLLVVLMERVRDSLAAVDLRPTTWQGAGSVAAALLRRHDVQSARGNEDDLPEPVADAVMRAYFGGRIEVFSLGVFSNVTAYDVNSAYPSAAVTLPATAFGEWREVSDWREEYRSMMGVWLVEWDVPRAIIGPFPYRHKRTIYYPTSGTGWYHGVEVAAALALHPLGVSVRRGYVWHPAAPDWLPFDFLRDVYAERRRLKDAGQAAEKMLKLAVNSVYGKLAQGVGFRGTVPPFRSYAWAGHITAATRARLADLALAGGERNVVSMSTDGIVFLRDPGLPTGSGLGELERTRYRELFVAQPGIYSATDDSGNVVNRSRGFFQQEIDYPTLRAGWEREGPWHVQATIGDRFVGLGAALAHREPADYWRRWMTVERRLSLWPARKIPRGLLDGQEWTGRALALGLLPPANPRPGELSDAYVPKAGMLAVPDGAGEYTAGMEQPLRV